MRIFQPKNEQGQDLVAVNNEGKIDNSLLDIKTNLSDLEDTDLVGGKAIKNELDSLDARVETIEDTLDDISEFFDTEITDDNTLSTIIDKIPSIVNEISAENETDGVTGKAVVDYIDSQDFANNTKVDNIGNELYGKVITLDQVGNYGTTTDVITGIVVENPSSHGLKSFSALIFPNVQNDSVENIGEVTATCNITHVEKGIISINSAPITSWKKGEEIKFIFNEVIEVDDLVSNIQILLNLTNEDNAPVIFYDANSNSNTWFSTRVAASASPDGRVWFGKSRYKLIEVEFLATGLIQTIYDNQQQCHTDIDSLNSRINVIDTDQERSPFDVYEGDGGEDIICGFELKNNLYNNTPAKFNTVTFTEPLNTVDDVVLYAHVYYNNRLTATSLPVTHWEANTPLRFYFTNIVERGTGPIRVLISPSSTDGTLKPSKQHGVRIKHSNSPRPNANICWYNNNNNSYQWSTTGYSTFKITFSTSGIQAIKDNIQDIETKLDTLYPVHTGDRVVDTMKPVSCHTVWNELNDIKAGQNLQMVSYLATHTHGVNTVDGFEKDATHVTTNEKRWINELNEVVRGKYTKLSDTAQFYNTLGSELAKIPFIECYIQHSDCSSLANVLPSKFNEIVLHDVQNNSPADASPLYLQVETYDSSETKKYVSKPITNWKTISDYDGGTRHYIHGEDLHFVFDEDIEIDDDTISLKFYLTADSTSIIPVNKEKAPLIKIDPTNNGTLDWFTITNPQDVIETTSQNDMTNKAVNMSFVYRDGLITNSNTSIDIVDEVTEGNNNAVTSNAVAKKINELQNQSKDFISRSELDNAVTSTSNNAVTSKGIYNFVVDYTSEHGGGGSSDGKFDEIEVNGMYKSFTGSNSLQGNNIYGSNTQINSILDITGNLLSGTETTVYGQRGAINGTFILGSNSTINTSYDYNGNLILGSYSNICTPKIPNLIAGNNCSIKFNEDDFDTDCGKNPIMQEGFWSIGSIVDENYHNYPSAVPFDRRGVIFVSNNMATSPSDLCPTCCDDDNDDDEVPHFAVYWPSEKKIAARQYGNLKCTDDFNLLDKSNNYIIQNGKLVGGSNNNSDITLDSTVTSNSSNGVTSKGIFNFVNSKVDESKESLLNEIQQLKTEVDTNKNRISVLENDKSKEELLNEIQQLKTELQTLRQWVEDNFIKGVVVDDIPSDEEIAKHPEDDYNFVIYDEYAWPKPEMVLVLNIDSPNTTIDLTPWLSAAPGDGTTNISIDWGDISPISTMSLNNKTVSKKFEVYTVEERKDEITDKKGIDKSELHNNNIVTLNATDYPIGENSSSVGVIRHTYSNTGEYRITIKGEFKWGGDWVVDSKLQKSLTSIELPNNNSPIKFITIQAFIHCEQLKSIPKGLFDKCTEVTSFSQCFQSCESLKSIPEHLFDKCTKATDFSCCFQYCSQLQSVPKNLFNAKVAELSLCFNGCSSLSLLPELWLSHPTAGHFMCFTGCSNAINYDEAAAAGWT